MGSTEDMSLIKETLDYMMTEARDQDVVYFISAVGMNFKSRRDMWNFFAQNYEALQKRFAANTMLRYIVGRTINGLSKEADYEAVEKFFADKDTSKYAMVLAQTMEGMRAKITWIERSTGDIRAWLEKWERESKL